MERSAERSDSDDWVDRLDAVLDPLSEPELDVDDDFYTTIAATADVDVYSAEDAIDSVVLGSSSSSSSSSSISKAGATFQLNNDDIDGRLYSDNDAARTTMGYDTLGLLTQPQPEEEDDTSGGCGGIDGDFIEEGCDDTMQQLLSSSLPPSPDQLLEPLSSPSPSTQHFSKPMQYQLQSQSSSSSLSPPLSVHETFEIDEAELTMIQTSQLPSPSISSVMKDSDDNEDVVLMTTTTDNNIDSTTKPSSSPLEDNEVILSEIITDNDVHNDVMDVDDCGIIFNGGEQQQLAEKFQSTDESRQQDEELRRLLFHRMEMKKRAIYRSLLHLSDNSYSFIYDESTNNVMNNDDEPGLPYIGPDLKEQYEQLRTLLRKGLLGSTDDNIDDYSTDGNDNDEMAKTMSSNKSDNLSVHMNPPVQLFNVSAVLMGPRGHGKSLVLERCLASLSRLAGKRKERAIERKTHLKHDQAADNFCQSSFRIVRLNGLLYQGDNAVACTQEIARQIGVMSREERKRSRKIVKQMGVRRNRSNIQSEADLETPKSSKRLRRKQKSVAKMTLATPPPIDDPPQTPTSNNNKNNNDESHDLRIRRSGFNTYISLLDEVLRAARVDGIPILIVLDELDTFLAGGRSSKMELSEAGNSQQDGGSSDRQLLLYHLLDRVADHKFLVSFVGMTTDLTAVSKLEKRVQSRAEGSSKIIYFGHNHDYDDLVKCLLGRFYTPPGMNHCATDEYDEHTAMLEIREEVDFILRGNGESDINRVNSEEDDNQFTDDFALVRRVLQRNYNLIGSDMRWVCRVFDVALSLFASDIDEYMHQCLHRTNSEVLDCTPKLMPSHIAQALVAMGASLDDISRTLDWSVVPTQSTLERIRWGQLLNDPAHYSCLIGTNSRLITLLDLSGPQVAVLLAARRIEARDDARTNAEDEIESTRKRGISGGGSSSLMALPLTYQRIQDEYMTSFVASGRYTISSDRYPQHVLYRSCMDLMEVDIIRLKKEICGGGAFQYGHNDMLSSGSNISHAPLHVNLDWDLEFMGALKTGLLDCSTALREWGMKMN